MLKFTKDGKLVTQLPDIPDNARICNVAYADDHQYAPLAPRPRDRAHCTPTHSDTSS